MLATSIVCAAAVPGWPIVRAPLLLTRFFLLPSPYLTQASTASA